MAKKYFQRALSVGLSLALCAGLVVPGFAASFTDLKNAINGTGEYDQNGIVASTTDGVRNVTLNDDVVFDEDVDQSGKGSYIKIAEGANVVLNLNGNTIDGGYDAETGKEGNQDHIFYVFAGASLEINGGADTEDETRGTITGGNCETGYGFGGAIFTYGNLTVNNVDLEGNRANNYGGAIAAQGNATVTLNNTNVANNTAQYGGGISAQNGVEVVINGGSVSDNTAVVHGGGIYLNGSDAELSDVKMENNEAGENGGAMRIEEGSNVTMDGVNMAHNTAGLFGGAVNTYDSDVKMRNTAMTENQAGVGSGGLYIGSFEDDTVEFGENVDVSGNTVNGTSSNIQIDICDEDGTTEPVDRIPTLPEYERYEGTDLGKVDYDDEEYRLVRWNYVVPATDDSVPPTTGGSDEVEIDDVDVPLAGLFTRADAIGYLWEQAGSPDAELSDFLDVPEDHQWAVAIGWAQDMGIAVADEEGNFRPDDLVLRSVDDIETYPEGEFQEFLNRYAVFAGIELDEGELFIELDGAWDDIIMGEDAQAIFDSFFAQLEAALAQAA